MIKEMTEDEVRDLAGKILKFKNTDKVQSGVGQLTSFNQLGFNGIKDRPDGWYLPKNVEEPAIILETKNSNQKLENFLDEVIKNCDIVSTKYNKVIGILYNGIDVIVLKNNEVIEAVDTLQNKDYYLSLFKENKKTYTENTNGIIIKVRDAAGNIATNETINVNKIDKQKIYGLTKKINDCLHTEFGIKNLYHRMIFTACALVAKRYGAMLIKGMNYPTFHTLIHSTLSKSLEDNRRQNQKLDILLEVYSEIKMNSTENQEAIDNFIEWVSEISECVNSDYWNGEDVMGIFFNEFNRYKKKSESGQVFTPEHITSLMYRLIDVHQDDRVLDAACGSGGFLVKSMSNMIKESGGIQTDKAKKIKSQQLFGIEFDREIFALACANMLIHKDGKTNLEQLDSRTLKAGEWMREKKITKVLMNPPFERKYGCLKIVENVLDNVPQHTMCAFILPDKKLEKDNSASILKHHQLQKIVKLPEKVFSEGVTTSVFIFEAGIPQNNKEIFACYIEDDGLETVKNQGRHDIKDRWQEIEDRFVDVVHKQNGDDTIQWINPNEHLSYQMPEKEFEIYEEDFSKTMMDYIMYQEGIDAKEFSDKLIEKVMYSSCVAEDGEDYVITLKGDNKDEK